SPFVNPAMTVLVVAGPNTKGVWAVPERYGVRMYCVTSEPLVIGVRQLTAIELLPGFPAGSCKNTGVPTRTDTRADSAPVPVALDAATANPYVLPSVRPVTMYDRAVGATTTVCCSTPA